jgi:small subunit ribosomal protein S3
MGQKVNPVGFRTGHFKPWKSMWFSDDSSYQDLLLEDIKIREFLMDRLKIAGIDKVEIARLTKSMVITVTVSRPGVVIGRGGSGIEDLKKQVIRIIKEVRGSLPKDQKIDLQVREIKNAEISAQLVAVRIAGELERRMPHRRVITRTMERVIQSGAKGIKIELSGRIGGSDIARREKYHTGPVPTQTMRGNIDYAQVPALLKRGYVGVKVWIYKTREDED